ncbi:MAG: 3-phosphoshikimate 1-carboxyvinyltransferase [Devosia sp.]|nr:3-phosphoshikimate 1-carboxyvinyltransferase [Devosia sp.]
MDHVTPALRPLAAERSPWLRGTLRLPGDKSISHRALMIGAMARGETVVEGLFEGGGVQATAEAMRAVGARIEIRAGRWHVTGIGVGGFLEPEHALDFGNSGTGAQLAMGLLGSYQFTTRFVGDSSLSARLMQCVLDPLRAIGVKVLEHDDNRLPITLHGPRTPVPIDYRMPVASARIKSCLLLAGLAMPGTTTVREPRATPDHTERMLEAFGAQIETRADQAGMHIVEIEGLPNLRAQQVPVPGDPSAAAFGMVAALIVPGSELVMENVMVNPTRTGLLDTLLEMGADIELMNLRRAGGEQVADLRVRHSELSGVTVPVQRVASMLGEYPALAMAAAFAQGETLMQGLGQLRGAANDRVAAVARGLRVNGVDCEDGPDSLLVRGRGRVKGGGRVTTHMDHRIAMSFLVMGMAADDAVIIDDQSTIAASFPDFVARFEDVGASFIRYTD